MFKRLLSPPAQSRAAKTVEIYALIIFAEGGLLLLFPNFMARLMHFGRTDHSHAMVFWRVAHPFALLFALEDSASWLWISLAWRAERRRSLS